MTAAEGNNLDVARAALMGAQVIAGPGAMTGNFEHDFAPMSWAALDGLQPPERPWVVQDWLPRRAVTLLAGSGGTGKSLWVQQWLTAICCGLPSVREAADPKARCLYINCEDDHDELWRRQHAINRTYGLKNVDLVESGLLIMPRLGKPNSLGQLNDAGVFVRSALFRMIQITAEVNKCGVIVLDNLAHHFIDNENDRAAVTAFCAALAAMAVELDAAVVIVGHPAKGIGSQFSGSTAWEAAVRNRLYLSHETDEDGREVEGSPTRTLSIRKSNYAARGQRVALRWQAGAFILEAEGDAAEAAKRAERAFLECLDDATRAGRNVSDKPSRNYAPAVFAATPAGRRIGKKALEAAMQRLFAGGQIVASAAIGRDERGRIKTGIARCGGPELPFNGPIAGPEKPAPNAPRTPPNAPRTPPNATASPRPEPAPRTGPERSKRLDPNAPPNAPIYFVYGGGAIQAPTTNDCEGPADE
jgi:RecA-family ATPase